MMDNRYYAAVLALTCVLFVSRCRIVESNCYRGVQFYPFSNEQSYVYVAYTDKGLSLGSRAIIWAIP